MLAQTNMTPSSKNAWCVLEEQRLLKSPLPVSKERGEQFAKFWTILIVLKCSWPATLQFSGTGTRNVRHTCPKLVTIQKNTWRTCNRKNSVQYLQRSSTTQMLIIIKLGLNLDCSLFMSLSHKSLKLFKRRLEEVNEISLLLFLF